MKSVRRFVPMLPVLWALLGGFASGCASRVIGMDDGGDADPDGHDPNGGDGAPDVHYRDVGPLYDVFHPDACPTDALQAVRAFNCDPFAPTSGCPDGQACYPSIEYPQGNCGEEIYHADCIAVGSVPQNGFCAGSAGLCAPGLSCFVTGAGDRCLQLCHIDGTGMACPRGAVCVPTDDPYYGACD